MQRLRLKADGRIVELRDGQEFPLAPESALRSPVLSLPQCRPRLHRFQRCATCAAVRA